MAKIDIPKEGELVEINMTDEERTTWLTMYVEQRCAPESFQVFNDAIERGDTIEIAVAQAAVNEMVIEAITYAIKLEEIKKNESE